MTSVNSAVSWCFSQGEAKFHNFKQRIYFVLALRPIPFTTSKNSDSIIKIWTVAGRVFDSYRMNFDSLGS